MQEILIDVVDSLADYTDDSMESPAVNYYVNQILFDIATGALTLVRAGGIEPVNISKDLDGRYRLISESDDRADEVFVSAGPQDVTFRTPFPEDTDGTYYTIPPIPGMTEQKAVMWGEATDKTRLGFKVNFKKAVTISYHASKIQ